MATPHVAGLAALIRSLHPEFTLAEVETAIKSTALDLGNAGWDKYFGHGRIQPPLALAWVPPDITAPVATLAGPIAGQRRRARNRPSGGRLRRAGDRRGRELGHAIRTGTGIWLDAAVTYNGVDASGDHRAGGALESNTAYRVVVGGAIEDLAGNLIVQDSWGFTTGDTIDPSSLESQPGDDATGVARGVTITITLDSKVTGRLRRDHPAARTTRPATGSP